MEVELSRMTEQDLPEVALLEQICFTDPWSERSLREESSRENAVFLTAKRDGELCGYIGMQFVLDEGYIANVAVAPFCRRQGIGRKMMERIKQEAQARHLAFLTLEVRESNLPAVSLYAGMGFEQAGRRKRYYFNPPEDALIMTLYLTQDTEEKRDGE